jgi:hypothetical protein
MTAHDSNKYLAWTNSHPHLCDRFGIKSAANRAPSLQDYLTGAVSRARTAPRNAELGVETQATPEAASGPQDAAA